MKKHGKTGFKAEHEKYGEHNPKSDGTNKKLLIVFAIIAIIGIVVAFDYLNRQNAASKYTKTDEGDEPKESLQQGNYAPYLPPESETAMSPEKVAKFVGECESMYKGDGLSTEWRERCITEIAMVAKDPSPCAKLTIRDTIDNCYFGVAVDTNNADLCKNVIYGRADCYTLIAEQTGNGNLCEDADYENEVCLEAGRTHTMSLCANVGDQRDLCMNAAFPGCDNRTFTQGTCTDIGDSLPPGDINECSKMYDNRGICYHRTARAGGKASLCENASPELKDDCYATVGVQTNSLNACKLAGVYKDKCTAWVAFNTDNPALCEMAGSEKESCLEDLMYKEAV